MRIHFLFKLFIKYGGDGGSKKYNRGVNSRNVYIAPEESVQYTLNKTPGTLKQKVMIMEAHGDLNITDDYTRD